MTVLVGDLLCPGVGLQARGYIHTLVHVCDLSELCIPVGDCVGCRGELGRGSWSPWKQGVCACVSVCRVSGSACAAGWPPGVRAESLGGAHRVAGPRKHWATVPVPKPGREKPAGARAGLAGAWALRQLLTVEGREGSPVPVKGSTRNVRGLWRSCGVWLISWLRAALAFCFGGWLGRCRRC